MTTSRDPDRLIRAFLAEGDETLQDRVYDVVRAEVEHKPQRAGSGPWRTPIMNKIVGFGLAAAAVVAAVLIGAQLLGSPTGGLGGPGDEPTPTPGASIAEPTPVPTPSPPAEAGIPEGPFRIADTQAGPDAASITVTIPASGWTTLPEFGALQKGEGEDPPAGAGAVLLAWTFPGGIYVYGDACQWSTTTPETPATTADEIAADLAAQASRDATAPVDVTVGGYPGKYITLHVPDDIALDTAGEFADCDQRRFASYGTAEEQPARYHQGPGQVDELWILDVDGKIVILDATYGPAAPADLVEEVRAIAESATFEAP